MGPEWITLIMFGSLVLLLMLGVRIAWVLGGVMIIATLVFWGPIGLRVLITATFGAIQSIFFVAIPLFVFMGIILQRSGMADDLFEMFYVWSGPIRGGLAIGSVLICAIFAAMTGLIGASCITMGLIATPAMLKRGYSKDIALGSVIAPATLGILIPPSVIMIILALLGKMSVGRLFFAGMVPGLAMTALFIIYILINGLIFPKSCPAAPVKASWRQRIILLRSVILPMIVIGSVLGSIFLGIATPTESAAVGAGALIIIAAARKKLNRQVIHASATETFRIAGLNMWILFCAVAFANVYTALGGTEFVRMVVTGLDIPPLGVIGMIIMLLLIMGLFIDPQAIIFIVAPLAFPIVRDLGFDPVWFGVIFVICVCTAHVTPPFGFSLFYMKSIAPPGISLGDIYHSVWPFLGCILGTLALVVFFPQLALWFPTLMIVPGG